MKFSIVTPCMNGMRHLPQCIASVRDQAGPRIAVEHIVADGGSSDGSQEWLERQPAELPGYRMQWFSGPDAGMYDAINKGWRIAAGDMLSWLNSDEQYLPGALDAVAGMLGGREDIDIIYGDTLLLSADGSLLAFRKAPPLRHAYLRGAHLYVHSSSLFVRRRCIADGGNWLDPRWRAAGDHEWMLRLLGSGALSRHLPRYLSAFMITGANLGATPPAAVELQTLQSREPSWVRALVPLLRVFRIAEKFLQGGFRQDFPLHYRLADAGGQRVSFTAHTASWRYPDR